MQLNMVIEVLNATGNLLLAGRIVWVFQQNRSLLAQVQCLPSRYLNMDIEEINGLKAEAQGTQERHA